MTHYTERLMWFVMANKSLTLIMNSIFIFSNLATSKKFTLFMSTYCFTAVCVGVGVNKLLLAQIQGVRIKTRSSPFHGKLR